MLLKGKWIDCERKIEVRNPYDSSIIDYVPQANSEQINTAIQSAQHGLTQMLRIAAHERSTILQKAVELLRKKLEPLSRCLVYEVGKQLKKLKLK